VVEDHHLAARFDFKDFVEALSFANEVGRVAEAEGHHPELCLSWGWLKVRIWTHAIDGLSENDFILAAKIDQLVGADAGAEPV
jgi:4a-hydroxytetrahydrobiopterin dehydratase